ncbi:hypothetical protein D3C87_941710 [compost metagenome]
MLRFRQLIQKRNFHTSITSLNSNEAKLQEINKKLQWHYNIRDRFAQFGGLSLVSFASCCAATHYGDIDGIYAASSLMCFVVSGFGVSATAKDIDKLEIQKEILEK